MQSKVLYRDGFWIIGISARTSNQQEMSGDGKIGKLWQRFHGERILEKIPNQVSPGTVMAIYTNYASDESGDYDFIVGTPVLDPSNVPVGLVAKNVPSSEYAQFTTERGAMPGIVINAWKYIWSLRGSSSPGGHRRYTADFEIYDERARDIANAQVDIYVAIQKKDNS